MSKKLCLIALSCALAGGWNTVSAQDKLVIHAKSGDAPQEFVLDDLGKMTFSDSGLFLFGKTGTKLAQTNFDQVARIEFSLTTVGIPTIVDVPKCFPYPSPAAETISLAGWNGSESAEVSIYSMDGRLCLVQQDWKGEPINVSSLTKGLYVLKINNQTFKFSKL